MTVQKTEALSLYIHIPFCAKKCRYCDFYSVKYDPDLADAYVEAVAKEWELVGKENGIGSARIETVYVGGGTPSLLTIAQWEKLIDSTGALKPGNGTTEWTVECNPDSFTNEKAHFLADRGVTRLTFGVQSMHDTELRILGRIHSARRVTEVLSDPSLSRFMSIGADLIYALPHQSFDSVEQSIRALMDFPVVKHLSLYELTVNERTPFGRHRALLPLPQEEEVCEMYGIIGELCSGFGFERYEISNYARPGHRCRHNEVYWDHKPYIGLGCSAHSYLHPRRWANIDNVEEYIAEIHDNTRPVSFEEDLDSETLAREIIFLSLRRTEGIDEEQFERVTGTAFTGSSRMDKLSEFLARGQMIRNNKQWKLTSSGMLIADAIARELID